MSTAVVAVPMTSEGFRAVVARQIRTWGRRAVALVKRTGNIFTRGLNRLHVPQAARWVATTAALGASKAWQFAKVPLFWVGPPIAAVLFAPWFVAVAMLLLLGSVVNLTFWVSRLRKQTPVETRKTLEDIQDTLFDLRKRLRDLPDEDVVDPVYVDTGYVPDYGYLDEDELVDDVEEEAEEEVVEEIVDEITEEITDEIGHVVEDAVEKHFAAEMGPGLVIEHEGEAVRRRTAAQPFPTAVDYVHAPLPVPYEILQKRWIELIKAAEQARADKDVGLYSEIIGREAVVLTRTGDPVNKLKPDATWNSIHAWNRRKQTEEAPDFDWNWTRMSNGSRDEAKFLKELAERVPAGTAS